MAINLGAVASVVVGAPIVGGTSGRIIYNNAGVVGQMTTTGSGTVVVLATGASLITPALGVATATSLAIGGATLGSNAFAVTGHLLLEGVTSTGATGTGSLVFASSPSLITPALGVATATSLAIGGAVIASNGLAVTGTTLLSGTVTMSAGAVGPLTVTANSSTTQSFVAVDSNTGGKQWYLSPGAGTGNPAELNIYNATNSNIVAKFSSAGAITAVTTLSTAAPAGASAGAWKLGSLVTAAVVLDTTRSLYVDIGGTVYHLMVST